ncbi:hypothetical protein [Halorientalis pallida]|uniref:Flagellin FlaB n=1 Tax=Halorientalis pallida TaxID=2479928 RepID=A0A498KU41_9EURY|nr:hypothetical protein [Halorientalis pallida]RXK48521.1 hypothetical protein EAF64_12635 [Halorientalis pallida]
MHRRRVLRLAGVTATTLAVAGCSGQDGSTDPADAADEDDTAGQDEDAATDEGTPTAEPTTEDESRETDDPQVTDRLDVISTVGLVAEERISAVELLVALAPGSDPVDLRDLVIQWVDDDGSYDVVAASSDATDTAVDGTFRTTPIKDSDGSAPVLNEPGDRLKLTIALGTDDEVSGADGFGEPLEPEADAVLRIATESGATTTVRLAVPSTLADERAVIL